MMQTLRKGNESIYISYLNGGWSNSLSASDFILEAQPERVMLSMDFSVNQRTRRKDGHSYMDVMQLIEKVSGVEYFQIQRDKWLDPFARALNSFPDATRELKVLFKDGITHTYRYRLEVADFNVTFNVM
jgi:tetrahydromethanopterin S-methyltransferase subunit B